MALLMPVCILAIEDERARTFMESLYLEHRSLMFRVAYAILRDTYAVEDAIHNAIVSLCNHIEKLRQMECCKRRAYVVTTIENACRDMQRGNRKYIFSGEEGLFDVIPDPSVDVADAVLCADDVERLYRALAQLPERERTALRMKCIEEQNDAAIAQVIGMKASSVRTFILRARAHLRKVMEEEGPYERAAKAGVQRGG